MDGQQQLTPEQYAQQEKQAAETGEQKLMAFQVGIARACNDMGVAYDGLAKAAGCSTEMMAPLLVDRLIRASEAA